MPPPLTLLRMSIRRAACTALVGLGTDLALSSAIVLVAAGFIGQMSFWIAGRNRPTR